jgi:hypothetical protein
MSRGRNSMASMMEKVNAHRYKGKSMRPGGGGRFAKAKDEMMAEGAPAKVASARLAVAGRKKYGAERMARWAAAGRKRAS